MTQAELDSLHIVNLNQTIDEYKAFCDTLHAEILASYERNIEICEIWRQSNHDTCAMWLQSIALLCAVFIFFYLTTKKK